MKTRVAPEMVGSPTHSHYGSQIGLSTNLAGAHCRHWLCAVSLSKAKLFSEKLNIICLATIYWRMLRRCFLLAPFSRGLRLRRGLRPDRSFLVTNFASRFSGMADT